MSEKLRQVSTLSHFYAHQTPGDGSCLIHSLLYLLLPRYRHQTYHEKKLYVRQIRNELAEQLPKYWNESLFNEASQALPDEYSLVGLQKCLRSDDYLNEFIVHFLENLFDIHIIILNEKTRKIYQMATEPVVRQATILLNYTHQHFESILFEHQRGHYTATFYNDDSNLLEFIRAH